METTQEAPKGFREISDSMKSNLQALGIAHPVGIKQKQRGGAFRSLWLVIDADGKTYGADMDDDLNTYLTGRK